MRQQIDTDRLVLVVTSNYPPLPVNDEGRLELREIPWVIREQGSGTRQVLEDLVAREGFAFDDLRIFLVLPGNEAIREAVEAGAGATIISKQVVASAIETGRLRANPINLPPRDFALLSHRDRHASPAQRVLVQHLSGARSS